MKLDRNINPCGRGKYALINLRTNQVQWGGDDQFFVIKYKDQFAGPALAAYAKAVEAKGIEFEKLAKSKHPRKHFYAKAAREMFEYADQIFQEAKLALNWPVKKIPD